MEGAADCKKRRVIVTGAGNGLGLAIARRFSVAGARVLLVDRDPVVLTRIGNEQLPAGRSFALVKDLADDGADEDIMRAAVESMGLVDALINNAAWSFHRPMREVTRAEFDRLLRINQRAPFFLAQWFYKLIAEAEVRPDDPVIVNIASVNASRGNRNLVAYSGTKGAIVAMSRAMAVEMSDAGIRVNSISPGAVYTSATESLIRGGVMPFEQPFEKALIHRYASCEEIAEAVMYLCSPSAAYVNGADWVIDGGYMAG